MDKEFIKHLPSEIVFDIFSRLPIQSITICKCVGKSWRNLLGSDEFVKFHNSQSAPGLVIGPGVPEKNNRSCKLFETNDDLDLEHHELHYRLFTEFRFPHVAALRGSANGLLFLYCSYFERDHLYICNPITRDYINLPTDFIRRTTTTYGFGASRMSGQHKMVRILHGFKRDISGRVRPSEFECHVYTLGTGSWKSIEASSGDTLIYTGSHAKAFVNGNLHWLAHDEVNRTRSISCFDLETEVFSTFPPPRPGGHLCVFEKCLCFCEDSSDSLIIWLAKDEKCWTKEFVITKSIFSSVCHYKHYDMYPIIVFRDGDILIAPLMLCYSAKTTKTSQKLGIYDRFCEEAIIYTPSLLSLKSFGIESATFF